MLSPQRLKQLEELERKLGISFINKSLLNQSFTHSSYAHEARKKDVHDNEKLEFLGDAVLKLVASEYLLNKFPDKNEGDLTKIRSGVVSDEALAEIAKDLKLGKYLLLGANESQSGGSTRKSNLANSFEALIGAIYLDSGIGRSRDVILELLKPKIDVVTTEGYIGDYKSVLQEYVQKMGWGLPHYIVIKESGPRHRRTFYMEVKIKDKVYGYAKGLSKKEAEQNIAEIAYNKLRKLREHGHSRIRKDQRRKI